MRTWIPRFPRNARAARRGAMSHRRRTTGFTLIEMMIVIAIISILAGIAAMQYQKTVLRSREAVLKSDLHVMRQAIENFTLDKLAAPQSLEDLVSARYLREIPTDQITRQKDWRTSSEDVVLSPDQPTSGITDVHSNSEQVSTEGTPYSSW